MDAERLIKIVIMDLNNDKLKIEEDLEWVINSDLDAKTKSQKIRSLLGELVIVEASTSKFMNMMKSENNNKNKTQ